MLPYLIRPNEILQKLTRRQGLTGSYLFVSPHDRVKLERNASPSDVLRTSVALNFPMHKLFEKRKLTISAADRLP